jgi:Raf kinase inhibitor-like YbhB/YbcL family protein
LKENILKKRISLLLGLSILILGACTTPSDSSEPEAPPPAVEFTEPIEAPEPTEAPAEEIEESAAFELTSTAFAQGESIPVKYSCDGDDISPPLTWSDPPEGTQSLALIMDDPDAPGGAWDHWVVFNMSADVREFSEAGSVTAITGKNSWGRSDYGGPCPPGGTHRYFFKLYALDTALSLDENANKSQVLAAMEGHILVEAELMGTFSR